MKILNGIVLLVALVMLSIVAIAGYKRVVNQPAEKSEGAATSMAGSDPIGHSEADSNQLPAGNSQEEWQAQRQRAFELNEEQSRTAAQARYALESFRNRVTNAGVNPEALDMYDRKTRTGNQMMAWREFESCVGMFSSLVGQLRMTANSLTMDNLVSVTESGQRIVMGQMTCIEILEATIDYKQRSSCERSMSYFEMDEARLHETYRECEEKGRRAGIYPEQVQEILQLP